MSGMAWAKFYWSDWRSDPALRLCSFAARGLWMDLLCVAAEHDPIGYVAVAGRGLNETDIARMTGGSECEVASLLGELDRNGVFSRDRQGRIYSRRMVRDARKAAQARKNGKLGGNPTLGKDKGNSASDNPSVKGRVNTQKPDTRSQRRITVVSSNEEPTAQNASPDQRAWSDAVILLVTAGRMSEVQARSFFGKLLTDHQLQPRDMLGALGEAYANGTQDPQGWLFKAAKSRGQRRHTGPEKRVGWV